jgi:hypothetical protein
VVREVLVYVYVVFERIENSNPHWGVGTVGSPNFTSNKSTDNGSYYRQISI